MEMEPKDEAQYKYVAVNDAGPQQQQQQQQQEQEQEGEAPWSWRKTLLGVLMIACIVVLFAVNSEVLQGIEAPYFVITLAHATGVLFVPLFFALLYRSWAPRNLEHRRAGEPLLVSFLRVEAPARLNSWPRTLLLSLLFATLYLVQNYIVVLAYSFSSVTLTNTVWRSSSLLVYLLSIWLLREKLLALKVLAVALGLAGVALLGVSNDPGAHGSRALGFVLALASAVGTAFFNVLFKRYGQAKSGTLLLAMLHMGLIGFWHIAVFWVGIPIVSAVGLEPWQWPSSAMWGQLALGASIAFVVNALTMLALVFTSPLFVSVGVDLVIPASWVADSITKVGFVIDALGISGICVVFAGFVILNVAAPLHRRCCRGRMEWTPPPLKKQASLIE